LALQHLKFLGCIVYNIFSLKKKIMYNTSKICIKLNYLCLANTSKIVQPRLSYSSRNSSSSSMFSSVVPIISYFNADTKKDAAIKQNKGKSGIYR